MNAGELDRRVTFQAPISVADAHGEMVETWADGDTVWAGVKAVAAGEGLEVEARTARQRITVKVRWRPNVSPKLRLVYEGQYYEIEGVTEIERREGLEIVAVGLNIQPGG